MAYEDWMLSENENKGWRKAQAQEVQERTERLAEELTEERGYAEKQGSR